MSAPAAQAELEQGQAQGHPDGRGQGMRDVYPDEAGQHEGRGKPEQSRRVAEVEVVAPQQLGGHLESGDGGQGREP